MIATTALSWWFVVQSPLEKHITIKKVESFSRLNSGWHYGEGIVFDNTRINDAIDLHNLAVKLGFFETDAFPGVDGSIVIAIYHKNNYLEFTITRNNEIIYRRETDDIEVGEEEIITFDRVKTVLEGLGQNTWKSSDSYISDITTTGGRDSIPQYLRTSGMGFQLLSSNASATQEEPSASIS